jgi:hypothetical protein
MSLTGRDVGSTCGVIEGLPFSLGMPSVPSPSPIPNFFAQVEDFTEFFSTFMWAGSHCHINIYISTTINVNTHGTPSTAMCHNYSLSVNMNCP